jgi:hypothetical protein
MEESKQRSLEEAAERIFPTDPGAYIDSLTRVGFVTHINNVRKKEGFIAGAEYMAERLEDTMIEFSEWVSLNFPNQGKFLSRYKSLDDTRGFYTTKQLLEKFKRK